MESRKVMEARADSMKKIISFSIWGSNPIYLQGAIENAKIAPEIYPAWICRFYCGNEVPASVQQELIARGCELEIVEERLGPWGGLFWRFYPAAEPDITIHFPR